MKQRIFLAAVLLWTVVNGFAQIGQAGQKVVTGSQWNIGWGQFEAYATPAKIQMTSVHEGETLAFELIPKGSNLYSYAAASEAVGENPQSGRESADRAPGGKGGGEEPGGPEGGDLLR